MSTLFTRRKVLTGMGLLGLGSLLGGCDYSPKLNFKYGKDLSDKIMGRTFKLKNTDGETVTLSSYRGLMPVVFFGFLLSSPYPMSMPANCNFGNLGATAFSAL